MVFPAVIKCAFAAILIVQASAFIRPSTSVMGPATAQTTAATWSGNDRREFICYALPDKRGGIAGIGGLNIKPSQNAINTKAMKGPMNKVAQSPQKAKSGPAKSDSKNNTKVAKSIDNPKADIDWGKIIVAFLTPWRNPNSIFLYLLIIVSLLGEANKQ